MKEQEEVDDIVPNTVTKFAAIAEMFSRYGERLQKLEEREYCNYCNRCRCHEHD